MNKKEALTWSTASIFDNQVEIIFWKNGGLHRFLSKISKELFSWENVE